MTVVRNNPLVRGDVLLTENHNERKNKTYSNLDVVSEESHKNIHFKECEGTYLDKFDSMVESKEISLRGQRNNEADPKIMGEMIFDVNSRYFEENGGYEFAKKFYQKAYEYAVQQVGGEDYVLSAVMHADERNVALSKEKGHDVFHYHLHVVYIPVVDKEIKYTKRVKDKSLVGTVKEVVKQVSHSKKWKSDNALTQDGKKVYKKSYSQLQDDFNEYMRGAGYDVERGQKGSTAEHLSVLEFKTQKQDDVLQSLILQAMSQKEVLDEYEKSEKQKDEKLAQKDKELAKKDKEITHYDNKIVTKKKVLAMEIEVVEMGKKIPLTDNIIFTAKEVKKLKSLAVQGIVMKDENDVLKAQNHNLKLDVNHWKKKFADLQSLFDSFKEKQREFKKSVSGFLDAMSFAKDRVADFINGVLHEKHEQEAQAEAEKPVKKKSFDMEL